MSKKFNLFSDFKSDFASGLVVFLVALPLCLGIALASGAPLFSGIISGIVGGIVVGYLSTSHLSVSGPAAGLTAIILTAISDLGAFNILLLAVFIAGLVQLALGFLKAGTISNYFPSNVIEGMLAGIGLIIILKQIPHAIGLDSDFEGDQAFSQINGENTFTELFSIFDYFQVGSIIVTAVSLAILILWNKVSFLKSLKVVPGALVAVVVGVLLNEYFIQTGSSFTISKDHLVSLPVPESFDELKAIFVLPDFSAITNSKVWVVGFTIAIVASIETLLCIEAADKMDSQKRFTDTNVELKAQGIGNMISAMLGGLPMTSVVVRTSANNAAGAKSKLSAIIHGVFLLVSVFAIPTILNKIPYATLAAILLLVGYKLANPKTLKHFWQKDKIYQFIPFLATFVFVVLTDLLKGVAIGLVINVIFILIGNSKRAYSFRKEEYHDGDIIHIDLAQEVSFLNKAAIKSTLTDLPDNSKVVINARETAYIAHDVLDLINDFKQIQSRERNIKVKLTGFKKAYNIEDSEPFKKSVTVEHYDALKRKIVTTKE
ncbi:MAG: SulP family inorganic anion transporter [Flavobacteriaceae bacterium]|jgi:MFS superfamily sulfate permease-like transporter|uniref:SulP family inorganic anion transporter n=1 Tax=Flavobacterium kayseriense TaxID=2764714 RepID=A0ABR7J987_9FLAO|nr:SulP family inorganic anion transporter [Flavobacterium kayseriense]MBC5842027.1 SulP family inorganic anion transporter [Flavobacterium kayseriense]MBC5848556.1 SulP family inorganic anion transporter [Flavobacterium kayseriense]MBU0941232.1 SulP family inorganic anion transporter [Bacteroidota bacterium]MBX9887929.1 SulP family inorganic anion transporter [Flavobacteriaceae bacterium]